MKSFKVFIVEQKDPEAKEKAHLSHFNSEIDRVKKETGKDHITLHHNGKKYHITHAEKVTGTPKADFKLHDKNGKHVYISHKDYKGSGDAAKSYNQLGGVSKFKDHPSVKKFQSEVQKKHGGSAEGKGTISMTLDNKNKAHHDLVKKALFGHEHGSKEHGPNAVHSLVQGKMNLKKTKDGHSIEAHHIMHHDEPLKHDYHIFARTAKSGSSKRNDLGLHNTRVGIGLRTGRKISHTVG
jgi:hypothetical protein